MAELETFAVTLGPSGRVFTVRAGQTLLQGAEAGGIALPSSCRNGTCRTCLCRAEGPVRHLIEWPGLSLDEKRAGCILPCIAVPCADLTLWPA